MKRTCLSGDLILGLGLILLGTLPLAAGSVPVGSVQGVEGLARLNGTPAVSHTTVLAGDLLSTPKGSRLVVSLGDAGAVVFESESEAVVDRAEDGVELTLARGRLLVQQRVDGRVRVLAGDSEVELLPRESSTTVCAVAVAGLSASVDCPQGQAMIWARGTHSPLLVPAGYRAVRSGAARGAQGAGSGQRAGEITAVIPQTNVERAAQALPAAVNTELQWNDMVRTERRGRARVGLDDGSVLNVGSDSQVRIETIAATTGVTSLEMAVGKMRVVVHKLPGKEFRLRTSTAVLGVIGTDFFVEATLTYTRVTVFEGLVQVSSILAGVGGQTAVGAGQQSLINAGQPPSAPSPAQVSAPSAANQTGIQGAASTATSTAWAIAPIVAAVTLPPLIVTAVDKEPVSPSQP